jgi:aspartate ammonia-lyase
MAMQTAFRVIAHDTEITLAASNGELELNAFLPLVADALLDSLQILYRLNPLFAACVAGITAHPAHCRELMERSRETATALIPLIGHEKAIQLARHMQETGQSLKEAVKELGLISGAELTDLLKVEHLCALGWREKE